MTKRVIRDYFTAFHWRKLKKIKLNMFVYIEFILILPLVTQVFETMAGTLAYMTVMLPMMFTMFSASLHRIALPKMMYLCPMSRDMRKEYLVKSYYVQVAIPMMLAFLGVTVLLFTGLCDVVCVMGNGLNTMLYSAFMSFGFYEMGHDKIVTHGHKVIKVSMKRQAIEVFGLFIGLVSAMTYLSVMRREWSGVVWLKWCLIGVTLLIMLPMTIMKYKLYWKEAIEHALGYETGYQIVEE